MERFNRRILGFSAALAVCLAIHVHASITVVTPGNMDGWSFQVTDDSGNAAPGWNGDSGQMVTGPATPPLGTGSAQLATTAAGGNGASRISTAAYDGLALSSITSLGYSTYATANNGQQFPFMEIAVSLDGSGSAVSEDSLFFEPPYQSQSTGNPSLPNQGAPVPPNTSPALMNTWQTWNVLVGGLWDNNGNFNQGAGPNGVNSLAAFLALYPNATIMNNIVNGGAGNEGITLLVGEDGNYINNGYVDGVTINGTTYDFELTPVPEPTTMVAGAMLLLPFGASTLRMLRRKQTA